MYTILLFNNTENITYTFLIQIGGLMAPKILLTQIPSAEDLLQKQALAKILSDNEKQNFEQDVAEFQDFCIRMVIQKNSGAWRQTTRNYPSKVIHTVKSKFLQQGIRIISDPIYGFDYDMCVQSSKNIPSPAEFKEGADLPITPISIFEYDNNNLNVFLNRCFQEIKKYKQSFYTGDFKDIKINRANISDHTIDIATSKFKAAGWHVKVKHADKNFNIGEGAINKIGRGEAEMALSKYFYIRVPI